MNFLDPVLMILLGVFGYLVCLGILYAQTLYWEHKVSGMSVLMDYTEQDEYRMLVLCKKYFRLLIISLLIAIALFIEFAIVVWMVSIIKSI